MMLENERVYKNEDAIQEATTFIEKFRDKPTFTRLIEGYAEEVNNTKGTIVNLIILGPSRIDNDIEMGKAQFSGFSKDNDNKWQAEFTLEPEGVPCPVEVGYFKIK